MATYGGPRDGGKSSELGLNWPIRKNFDYEGVVAAGDMLVSQRAAGANLSVDVAAGDAHLHDGTSYFFVRADAVTNVVLATADATNPRIDAIVVYWDKAVASSAANDNPDDAIITKVTGTPAAAPVPPTDAAIESAVGASNPYHRIGNVTVVALDTTIADTDIQDTREFTQPTDAVRRDYASLPERVISGLQFADTANLVSTASVGVAVVRGRYCRQDRVENHTFTDEKDTYVDYCPTYSNTNGQGHFRYTEVGNGDGSTAEPAVASGCIRLQQVLTNGGSITSVTDLRNLYAGGILVPTATVDLTTAYQDATGASKTFEVSQASQLYAWLDWDWDGTVGTGTVSAGDVGIATLTVDGSAQTNNANYFWANAAQRGGSSGQTYKVSLASGAHTIKIQVRNSAGARGRSGTTHNRCTYMIRPYV